MIIAGRIWPRNRSRAFLEGLFISMIKVLTQKLPQFYQWHHWLRPSEFRPLLDVDCSHGIFVGLHPGHFYLPYCDKLLYHKEATDSMLSMYLEEARSMVTFSIRLTEIVYFSMISFLSEARSRSQTFLGGFWWTQMHLVELWLLRITMMKGFNIKTVPNSNVVPIGWDLLSSASCLT